MKRDTSFQYSEEYTLNIFLCAKKILIFYTNSLTVEAK